MKKILYVLWQWSWGFFQSLAGLAVLLFHLRRRHFWYHGAYVTVWSKRSSVALGMFIFLAEVSEPVQSRLLVHEYGHTVQSLLLGPAFLPLVGLPSVLWASRWKSGLRSYFSVYPENWANRLGERVTKSHAPE